MTMDPAAPADPLPIVLVHGYLGGAQQWSAQIDRLSRHGPVIALDLPGFGAASGQTAPDSIGGYAAHIIGALDDRGVGRFRLLGHSMGGMIAQEIAHRAPQRIDRLVLYGTGPLGRMPDRFEPLEVSLARLEREGVGPTVDRIVATWFSKGALHDGYGGLARIGAQTSADAARAALMAMARWDGRSYLAGLDARTLIVWGDEDRSYRWPQIETLWTAIPNASLAVIPGASHAAHVEKPAIFTAIVEDYLSCPA